MGKACSKANNKPPKKEELKPQDGSKTEKHQNLQKKNSTENISQNKNEDSILSDRNELDDHQIIIKNTYYTSEVSSNNLQKKNWDFHSMLNLLEEDIDPTLLELFKFFVSGKMKNTKNIEKKDYYGFFPIEKEKSDVLNILQYFFDEENLKMFYSEPISSGNSKYNKDFNISTLHYLASNVSKTILRMKIEFKNQIVIDSDPVDVKKHLHKYDKWIMKNIFNEFHQNSKSKLYLLGYKFQSFKILKLYYYFSNLNQSEIERVYAKFRSEMEPFLLAHSKNIEHGDIKKKVILNKFRAYESEFKISKSHLMTDWNEVLVDYRKNPNILDQENTIIFVAPFHNCNDYVYEYIANGNDISIFKNLYQDHTCGNGIIATEDAFGFTSKSGVQIRPVFITEENKWMILLLKCRVASETVRIPHTFNNFFLVKNPEFIVVESILYRSISENQALILMA